MPLGGQLETAFTWEDYDKVELDDDRYVTQTASGSEYAVFHFYWKNTNNADYIDARWTGKSDRAPSASPVYLDVYNMVTNAWENIASNSTAAADTEFVLHGQVYKANMAPYYTTGYWTIFRVYQRSA